MTSYTVKFLAQFYAFLGNLKKIACVFTGPCQIEMLDTDLSDPSHLWGIISYQNETAGQFALKFGNDSEFGGEKIMVTRIT